MNPVLRRFLPLLAVILLAVSACGGDSSDGADATTTTAAAGSSTSSGPTTTLVGSDPDSEFCLTVDRLNENHSLDPATAGTEGGVDVMREAFDELAAVAPDDLVESIQIVSAAVGDIGEAKARTQDELEEINRTVTQSDVNEASLRLENYVKETCGVPLGG